MKDKIMIFVIGVLVGAVISTGAFYIYYANNSDKCSNIIEREGGEPPEMPSGQSGTPPEKPSNNNTENNN